jgi:ABC-type nickel/cobalt efflux system permease component RcnA
LSVLQHWLAGHGVGGLTLAFLVAALMGLRHATDPDHLTAVSTLVLSDRRRGARSAARHGLAWGLGHGVTLFLFGLPVVFFDAFLAPTLQRVAEAAIGAVIVLLAARLLLRWRRGYFHSHPHRHGLIEHAHPHAHESAPAHDARVDDTVPVAHAHTHAEDLGAGALQAFGVGLLHGVGGSAAAGALMIAAVADGTSGAGALVVYAGTTAGAMAVVSAGVGQALVWGWAGRRFETVVPAFAAFGVFFGVWYALAAF